jgi:hypothetical protein
VAAQDGPGHRAIAVPTLAFAQVKRAIPGVRLGPAGEAAFAHTHRAAREPREQRLSVLCADIILKIEMVNDVPAHVGELMRDPVLGLRDSAENILANKLTAVVDRKEPRDLADIWGFCCQLGLSCEVALEGAQSKESVCSRPTSPECC